MMNFRSIAEKLSQNDTISINRIRISVISVTSLVFAFFLYQIMFGTSSLSDSQSMLALTKPLPEKVIIQAQTISPLVLSTPLANEGDGEQQLSIISSEKPVIVQESSMQYVAPQDTPVISHSPLDISAKAVFVANDSLTKILYEKNADRELPEASLTKLMTAVVVFENTKLDDVITITKNAVNTEGVAGNLRIGEKFTVGDLLKIMLITSSNDAAVAFEDYFSTQNSSLIELMNQKAVTLGMDNTHFVNVDGLDSKGHVSTARDLAKLVSFSLHNDALWDILSKRSDSVVSRNMKIAHQLVTTNELLIHRVAGVKGGKTGYTQNAMGCMITVTNSDPANIIIILGSQDRFSDTKSLVLFTQQL